MSNELSLPSRVIIGLMSGTSMDGIDACAARLSLQVDANNQAIGLTWERLGVERQQYSDALSAQLDALVAHQNLNSATMSDLNTAVGAAFAQVATRLQAQLAEKGILIDAIASHGQTVYHQPPQQPPQDGQNGHSIQLGDPRIIAAACQCPVISDFRNPDMALGGQGAPLVPFVDQLLFQQEASAVVALNLGGIANITIIPAKNRGQAVTGFDTGPANTLIDQLCQHHFGCAYDKDGRFAAEGQVNETLLNALFDADPFPRQAPPKSTGREHYSRHFMTQHFLSTALAPVDQIATATAYTAKTIAQALAQFVLPTTPVQRLYVAGGGSLNPILMRHLRTELTPLGISIALQETVCGIPSAEKEAFAFAVLGYARLFDVPNTLPSVTGARAACSAGSIVLK